MSALADLTEEEKFLLAILTDPSGVDQAEFSWVDETSPDSLFRCWDFQVGWYRDQSKLQIDQCGRAVGKSAGIQMRAFAFPFCHPGEEMLLTAPEMIHLDPVTKAVEDRLRSCRLSQEFLAVGRASDGFTHRPFEARFRNGARIVGRIPQKDGKGVKGMHPFKLEMDEAQDYPPAGWVELGETLKYGRDGSTWRAHGVSRGVRDDFFKKSQPGSGWRVHQFTAVHREDWSDEERKAKAEMYGSTEHPDYRRNIMGLHGDASSSLFVLTRLMACVDQDESSAYNTGLYTHLRISDERLKDSGLPIAELIDIPGSHAKFERTWIGMDVGMTRHPTEILVFGEERVKVRTEMKDRLRLLTRVHLERITAPAQRQVLEKLWHAYSPQAVALDRTGLGLPIYQEVLQGEARGLARVIQGFNFSERIVVGWSEQDEDKVSEAITANVLEYSSDLLRLLVDQGRLHLPWDMDLLREFQGQTYVITKSGLDAYGRRSYSKGKFHALDAARMAVLAMHQSTVESVDAPEAEPVLDGWLEY